MFGDIPVIRSDGAVFPTRREAAKASGVTAAYMHALCCGLQLSARGCGYGFAYVTDDSELVQHRFAIAEARRAYEEALHKAGGIDAVRFALWQGAARWKAAKLDGRRFVERHAEAMGKAAGRQAETSAAA